MHPVIYYIFFFLLLGAAGMAIANQKVESVIRRQRWLKYFTYLLITGIVIAGIFYKVFYLIAWLISIVSWLELIKLNIDKHRSSLHNALLPFSVFFLVAVGFILFAYIFQNSFILFIYFQVLVFDGFCQITGQLFGKHPMVPAISPSKTWEGFAGGWFCGMVAALLAHSWISISITTAFLFGFFTGLTCFTGDLLASFYKRKIQVKDYSNWLPGQGGFLDRFDSFLFTGFFYYLLYIIIFKDRSEFNFFIKL